MTSQFTAAGIILAGFLLWLAGNGASPGTRKLINGFLAVLLFSIVILRFNAIRPLFFKSK